MGRTPENFSGTSFERRRRGVQPTEAEKMRDVLRAYEPHLGSFELVQVGDAGWVLQRQGRQMLAYPHIVVTCDVDDTLIATNKIKQLRIKRFGTLLKERGSELPDEAVSDLMDASYAYSQRVLGKGTYNMDNHALVLAYAIGQSGTGQIPEDLETQVDPDMLTSCQNILQETLHMIPQYHNTVAALEALGRQKEQEEMAINLFTYGTPPEQLVKSLNLLKNNSDLHDTIDQIWITKVPKDEFMKTVIKTGALKDLARRYRDGQERGGGDIFGSHSHVIVGLDDSLQSVNSQSNIASTLQETGAELTLVRVRQQGAKDADKDWKERGEHEEIDLRKNPGTGQEIAAYVLELAKRRLAGRSERVARRFPAAA